MQSEGNAWTAYVGDIEIGSHRTVEQMRAIELNSRRACNRGTMFESDAGLRVVGATMDERRDRGAAGEVQRAIDFICPPQSRSAIASGFNIDAFSAERDDQYEEDMGTYRDMISEGIE